MVRVVHPAKRSRNRSLSREEESFNRKVASDRIILENVFGRLCTLWRIIGCKFRWAEDLYDTIFAFVCL